MARALAQPVRVSAPTQGVDGRTVLGKNRGPTSRDGRIGDFWVDTLAKKLYGPKNASGWPDNGLIKGDRGWVASLAIVADGARRVHRVVDWIGGEGAKPSVGQYVGETGLVTAIADAADIRGAQGPEMLISGLTVGTGDASYETLTAVAEEAGDNRRRKLKDFLSVGGGLEFLTVAEAQGALVPKRAKSVRILQAPVDLGGPGHLRRRVSSEPQDGPKHRSADRFLPDGSVDSVDGGWWALDNTAVSQAVAEAGVQPYGTVPPLRVKQQIDAHRSAIRASGPARTFGSRFNDFHCIKDFPGIVANGVLDDTAAIQAAINSLPGSPNDPMRFERGSTLYFPDGTYRISNEIVVDGNIRLVAHGSVSFVGNVSGSAHGCAFYLGSPSYISPTGAGDGYLNVTIEGFNFGGISGHAHAIRSDGIRTVRIERNTFHGGVTASVQITGAWATSWVKGNWFEGGSNGALRLHAGCNAFQIEGNRFAGYDDTPTDGLALHVQACTGVWITLNDFEYNRRHISIAGTNDGTCNNIHIENNWLEGAIDYTLRYDNSVFGTTAITFHGNSVYSDSDGGVYIGLFGGAGVIDGLCVTGNGFYGAAQLFLGSSPGKYKNVHMAGNTPESANGAPAFVAHKNGTDQTAIPSETYTKITFGTEAFDRRSCYDAAASRFTPQNGRVRLKASVNFTAGIVAAQVYILAIYKNGNPWKRQIATAHYTNGLHMSVEAVDEAGGTDYYEVFAYGGGAGNKTIDGDAGNTWFEGETIR